MVMENWSVTDDTSRRFYIMCLTLDGIPLFSRVEGNLPTLPFPVVGSLNGVHMFIKNNSAELGITNAENAKILWREFSNIKLIIVNFDMTKEYHLNLMLENVYKCMVMVTGENEFTKITNVEKLKKKIRLSIPLIMTYLNNKLPLVGNVTQSTDIVHCSDVSLLQNCLNAFTEDCQSEFGCLTLNGKVIVGTEKFWQLLPIETSLMLFLHQSKPTSSSSDMPIYLPHGSPTVPHRLISAKLLEGINVMIVCGPEPSLQEVGDKYVKKYWLPFIPMLKGCLRSDPRCFSPDIKLDVNVLGFILLNTTDGKCLSSLYPHGNMTGADQVYLSELDKRQMELLRFYKSVVGELFVDQAESEKSPIHEVTEAYKSTNRSKCYALKTTNHQMFVLFTTDIPTYAMGSICRQTLKQLTKDHIL